MPVRHRERHRTEHTGWLRAAVLGANDGILSTASLVLGVAAAHGSRNTCCSRGSRAWSLGLCRWLRVSTCLCTHRQTPNRPTSRASERNSEQTTRASIRN